MRSVLKALNPADAGTVLSKLVNVLYLVLALVLAVAAIMRGEPLPVLPPMTQEVTVEAPATIPAAPVAPVVENAPAPLPAAPAVLEAPPVGEPDATPLTPGGTGTDAAMGLDEE